LSENYLFLNFFHQKGRNRRSKCDNQKYISPHQVIYGTNPRDYLGYLTEKDRIEVEVNEDEVEEAAIKWVDYLNTQQKIFGEKHFESYQGIIENTNRPKSFPVDSLVYSRNFLNNFDFKKA